VFASDTEVKAPSVVVESVVEASLPLWVTVVEPPRGEAAAGAREASRVGTGAGAREGEAALEATSAIKGAVISEGASIVVSRPRPRLVASVASDAIVGAAASVAGIDVAVSLANAVTGDVAAIVEASSPVALATGDLKPLVEPPPVPSTVGEALATIHAEDMDPAVDSLRSPGGLGPGASRVLARGTVPSLATAVVTIAAAGFLVPAIVGMNTAAAFVGDVLGPTDGVGLVPESSTSILPTFNS